MILLGGGVSLELHPVTALAPLGHALRQKIFVTELKNNVEHFPPHLAQPGPLDVGVLLAADAAHHPVVVHGVHYRGRVLGALNKCWL